MQRFGISRTDYLFAFFSAAAPGTAAVVILYILHAFPLPVLAGAIGLIVLAAAALAIAWARDAAVLRQKASSIGEDDASPRGFAGRTPIGAELSRQLEEARRRTLSMQRVLEGRALHAEIVIDALPEPMLVLDSRRQILHGNLAAENLLGSQLLGRSLAEVIRSPDALEGVERALLVRAPLDIDFVHIGPVERSMRARTAPLVRGGSVGLVIVLQDLTAIRRAEQTRVDFIANVSHELRTPLASLIGFIETLKGPAREDDAARERFLGIMSEQTQRMSRLVNDLLSLSRIEMEEHNPPAERVALGPLVASTLSLLEPIADERSVSLETSIASDLPDIVADPDQVAQVVRNLVENAIKYGREGGTVRVSAIVDGHAVALSVRDEGQGIPRRHLHRLTERFYRVDTARSRQAGGTGLGLAIVKHIVNRHRGRIAINSKPGEGSTFTIFWPTSSRAK